MSFSEIHTRVFQDGSEPSETSSLAGAVRAAIGAEGTENEVYPPRSNRGVRFTPKGGNSPNTGDSTDILEAVFFDWYQASVSVDPEKFIDELCAYYNATTRRAKPQPPYLDCREIVPLLNELESDENDKTPYCSVHFGGINEKLMFRSSSDRSIEASAWLREHYPDHSVSRVDVAMDFCEGPDFFRGLSNWLIDYARCKLGENNRELKVNLVGDWVGGKDGRTLYIGSRKSPVYIRLYEKGVEQQLKGNDSAPTDWVRLEAEIKPQKSGKQIMAKATPRECFGASKLLRDFAATFGPEVEPLKVGTVYQKTDWERSFGHMCYQYAETLELLLEKCGGDVSAFAEKILSTMDAERASRKGSRDKLKARSAQFDPGDPFWEK